MVDSTFVIGVTASVCTALSLLPQLIKLLREKSAQDISLWMLLVLFAGLTLWIAYGAMRRDWIIVVANSFSLLVNIAIVVLSLKYRK